ncbi:MAG: hypothetical protein H7251_07020 [Acetobacteraceae bacterium]|nr:hypothetical protein [Acetobacteraceae bacterium]
MEYEVLIIDAAFEQLGWAIRLFLDKKAYIAAITLAGAAEEILGKVLTEPSAHQILKTQLAAKYAMSEKIVSDEHLNRARNWLKHGTKGTGGERIVFDPEEDAKHLILRYLINWSRQSGCDDVDPVRSEPEWVRVEAGRFHRWISEIRSD